MASRVLLVLPSQSYRAEAFLDAARRAGIAVVLASDAPSSLAALVPGRETVVDLADAGLSLAAVERVVGGGVDGVVGVDEAAVIAAAEVAAHLGVARHHPVDAVRATRDKRAMRRRLAAARLPQPAFAEIGSSDPPGRLAEALAAVGGPPAVLKPVGLAASQGVLRADDLDALEAAAGRVAALLDRLGCVPEKTGHPLLVERFVAGAEIAVEALVTGGALHVLAIFDKPEPLDGPVFAETIYTTPSRLGEASRAAVAALTAAASAALGLSDGPVHAELRLPLGGPVVVEVAARSIGGLCSSALRVGPQGAWSLEELILRHAVGEALGPAELAPAVGASGVLMLPVPCAGTLRGVGGVAAARAVDGVESVRIAIAPGTAVEPLPEGARYLGFVVARAASPLEAEIALRAARATLRPRID